MRPCLSRMKARIIVAVMVVALAPWVVRVALVSRAHHLLAEEFKQRHEHDKLMAMAVRTSAAALRYSLYASIHREDARLYARHKQLAEYYFGLAEKHRRAAWRPWYSVAPDPPPPEDARCVDGE